MSRDTLKVNIAEILLARNARGLWGEMRTENTWLARMLSSRIRWSHNWEIGETVLHMFI